LLLLAMVGGAEQARWGWGRLLPSMPAGALSRRARRPAQVAVALMRDGTTAVELEGAHCLLAWPFAADVSLGAALAAVFAAPAPAPGPQAAPAPAAPAWRPAPWLYLNFLLTNSQLFLPVLDQARGAPLTPRR